MNEGRSIEGEDIYLDDEFQNIALLCSSLLFTTRESYLQPL